MTCRSTWQNSEERNARDHNENGAISSHFPRYMAAAAGLHKGFLHSVSMI